MNKRFLAAFLVGSVTLLLLAWRTEAADKVRLAHAIRTIPSYYLPILAAQEKGFWRENRLEVEWVVTGTGLILLQGIAAGSLDVGLSSGDAIIPGMARGVPAIVVANMQNYNPSALWVRADSLIKEPKALKKGARVAVTSMGGVAHAQGQQLLRALGMEKDVRFVATGGVPNTMAALKVGVVDAMTQTWWTVFHLEAKGEIRSLASTEDYSPAKLLAQVAFARKDYVKTRAEVLSRVIKALLQSTTFVAKNRAWAIEKMREELGLTSETAEAAFKRLDFSADGKIERDVIENTLKFLTEYDLVPQKRVPPIEELYTRQFTG